MLHQVSLIKSKSKSYASAFLLLCTVFTYSNPLYGNESVINSSEIATQEDNFQEKKHKRKKLTYYLYISDFINSFIEIPTSNVAVDSTTISSKYLAGRAPIYRQGDDCLTTNGTCSASFLCMQNANGIYTDISNYLSADNGLIVSWLTPTTLINLEVDSIVHSMVTDCIVIASTKIGFNPYYGDTFDLKVSSDDQKIYFKFTEKD